MAAVSAKPWAARFETSFFHPRSPFDVRVEIEKRTAMLVRLDRGALPRLAYTGSGSIAPVQYDLGLSFQTAFHQYNVFGFLVEASAAREWTRKRDFLRVTERAVGAWMNGLATTQDATTVALGPELPDRYDALVKEALEREELLANIEEDPMPIAELKRAVLEGLRAGRSFSTSHHEGGTVLFHDGTAFREQTYGAEESRRVFQAEDEMLRRVREFFDWESRRETYPHQPREVEVWRFIRRQLR